MCVFTARGSFAVQGFSSSPHQIVKFASSQKLEGQHNSESHIRRASKFGDIITADHKVFNAGGESLNDQRHEIVVRVLATQWLQSYPCRTKTSQESARNLRQFLDHEENPKVIYTDNSLKFEKASEDLQWNHCTSTPNRPETNEIAERTVRRAKEGTSFILLQSRLEEQWWAESVECYISKISCQVGKLYMNGGLNNNSVGQSYYSDQKSKIIPLGHFHGLCSRCAEEGWKGDLLVADVDEFQENDASEVFKENLNKSSCADRRRQIHNPMCKRSCEVGRKDESDLPTEFGKTSKTEKNIAVIFKEKTAEPESAQPKREQDELEARHDFANVVRATGKLSLLSDSSLLT